MPELVTGQSEIYCSYTGRKVHTTETCSVSSRSLAAGQENIRITWNTKWADALAKGKVQTCSKCWTD